MSTLQDMTPETLDGTVRRSQRTALVPKRLDYSPESSTVAKRGVRATLDRHRFISIRCFGVLSANVSAFVDREPNRRMAKQGRIKKWYLKKILISRKIQMLKTVT